MQHVGQDCASCGRPMRVEADVVHCAACGLGVHRACSARTSDGYRRAATPACPRCGGPMAASLAAHPAATTAPARWQAPFAFGFILLAIAGGLMGLALAIVGVTIVVAFARGGESTASMAGLGAIAVVVGVAGLAGTASVLRTPWDQLRFVRVQTRSRGREP